MSDNVATPATNLLENVLDDEDDSLTEESTDASEELSTADANVAALPEASSESSTSDAISEDLHASFTVRHPFQGIDVNKVAAGAFAACVAAGAVWLVRRLTRRRHGVSCAWAWTSEQPVDASTYTQVLAGQPLFGQRMVVSENIAVEGQPTSIAGCKAVAAAATHPALRTLSDAGAHISGAAKLDPLDLQTDALCNAVCRRVANPGLPGRALLGPACAGPALVAAGRADLAVAGDAGGEVLVAAACTALTAFRCSEGAASVSGSGSLTPCEALTVLAFAAADPGLLLKAGKALGLPGGGPALDVVRMLFAADLFQMLHEEAAEKVTNGIVSRAVTDWISDREHARQVALLEWLAKALDGWTRFAEPRGDAVEPAAVLAAIAAAHSAIAGRETAAFAEREAVDVGALPAEVRAEVRRGEEVTDSEYAAALELKAALAAKMGEALGTSTVLLIPIMAGAPPRAPLSKHGRAVAELSAQFGALVAMTGCPCVVLPVPAAGKKGAPWAVALLARHRCDLQLIQIAAKLLPSIKRAAKAVASESAKRGSGSKKGADGAGNGEKKGGSAKSRSAAAAAAERRAEGDSLKAKGNAAFKAGNYVESIKLYSAAIAAVPDSAVFYSNRAMAYLKLQQYEPAIADCDSSIKLGWTAKAALRRGTARAALGMWEQAQTDFEAVVKREPNNTQAAAQLRECRSMLNDSVFETPAVGSAEPGITL